MKLIDKIQQADSNKLSDYSRIYHPTAEVIEKIADEFAIEFAEWCIKKRVDFFDDTEIGITYTMTEGYSRYKINELLEIFKKEKGL